MNDIVGFPKEDAKGGVDEPSLLLVPNTTELRRTSGNFVEDSSNCDLWAMVLDGVDDATIRLIAQDAPNILARWIMEACPGVDVRLVPLAKWREWFGCGGISHQAHMQDPISFMMANALGAALTALVRTRDALPREPWNWRIRGFPVK